MQISLLNSFVHRMAAGLVLGVPAVTVALLLVPPGNLPPQTPWMLAYPAFLTNLCCGVHSGSICSFSLLGDTPHRRGE